MRPGALGLRRPPNSRHRALYPLTVGTVPDIPTPVVIGVNWYAAFDEPQVNHGFYWIGHRPNWGPIRGGHAICIKPPELRDLTDWWRWYDQGAEGACTGFAVSRMMSLLNRRRYVASLLYEEARRVDDWEGEDYDGTSVRAACDVARREGLWTVRGTTVRGPVPTEGIAENRWANSIPEIAACLSPDDAGQRVLDRGYVELLNSWGTGYPHTVRLPLEALDRLVFRESGEATVVTDRR